MFNGEKEVMGSSTKKPSGIDEQLNYCDRMGQKASALLLNLEEKLSPILRKAEKEDGLAEEKQLLTPLANKIRNIGENIEGLCGSLENITNRLEI